MHAKKKFKPFIIDLVSAPSFLDKISSIKNARFIFKNEIFFVDGSTLDLYFYS